jgi:polyhydroxybutyrate depolymerase
MLVCVRRFIIAVAVLLLLAGCGSLQPDPAPALPAGASETKTLVPTAASEAEPGPTSGPSAELPKTGPTATPVTPAASGYETPGDYTVGIVSFGSERTFLLHVPPGYKPDVPVPLVFNLHGYGSTAPQQRNQSGMNATADREGFVVVYPQALQNPPIWTGFMPGPAGYGDLRFFEDMIAYLQGEMNIDPARIYATGISNGAVMANFLACELSHLLAAIAPVAGNHIGYDTCHVEQPVSVIAFHGTADRTAPYEGGGSGVPPVHTWVEAWAQRDGCAASPETAQLNAKVKQETWTGCTGDVEVALYSIEGGQHEWPGASFGPGPYAEGLAPDIYATDVIWEFFAAHPKAAVPGSSDRGLAVPESGAERYQTPGDYVDRLSVAGVERWFTVHLPPSYQPGQALPLVINLHGYRGTAFAQEELTGMHAKADEVGFIAVHPQAYNDPPAWTGPLLDQGGELDLAFFRALLAYLQREIDVDPDRIYATGMSNGATMVNTLGCFMSDTFAAIAPVAGGHSAYGICPIEQPVSVLVIHGTQDPTIPFYGREGEVPAVHDWVQAWAERNGCEVTPTLGQPQADVNQETWQNCQSDTAVTLLAREGGGHVWPGTLLAEQREGQPSSLTATDVIWAFFETHPRSPAVDRAAMAAPQPTSTPRPTATPKPAVEYQTPGTFRDSLQVEGYRRHFAVHLPPMYQPGVPLPLVIDFHAHSHSVFQQAEISQMNAKADEEGFVVVHPQALGNPSTWYGYLPGLPGQIDLSFVAELLVYLRQEISIDPRRIYATGFSDGGAMANALACEMPETFAAVAPVSGFQGNLDNCAPDRPVSMLAIHGTADPVIPYEGWPGELPSAHLWLEAWAERNGCDPASQVEDLGQGLTVETWGDCDGGATVVLYTRQGGDHIWPGSVAGEQLEGGPANMNATDLIWEFFEAHPRLDTPEG